MKKKKTLSRKQISITGEADYICARANEGDARVVSLGPVVFFSSETGDAWMLDPEDGLALCLMRDGVKQDYSLLETESNFQIGWNAEYEIQENVFTVSTSDGSIRKIVGYPTADIVSVTRDIR